MTLHLKAEKAVIKYCTVLTEQGKQKLTKIKIGDFVALMICAYYQRHYHHRRLFLEYREVLHVNMRVDILFREVLEGFIAREVTDLPIYDPGALWVVAPTLFKQYGATILPTVCFDEQLYTGPKLPFSELIIFHPLYGATYNEARNMSRAFINETATYLHQLFGDKLLVICEQAHLLDDPQIPAITTTNLYDLLYIIGHCRAFIGGDTGFTHFAALARVPHLISLYGDNYCDSDYMQKIQLLALDYPHADMRQYRHCPFITLPLVDEQATQAQLLILFDHRLTSGDTQRFHQAMAGLASSISR